MAFATLIINKKKLIDNINHIKETIPNETRLLIIAKANAYGLGAPNICAAIKDHVDYFGVATLNEALEIRQNNIDTNILLLSEPITEDLSIISSEKIAITVYQKDTISAIDSFTKRTQKNIKTHLKIDTGMNRLGTQWKMSESMIKHWLSTSSYVIKEGLYSHFANSDDKNNKLNTIQLNRFKTIIQHHPYLIKHCSNSDAVKNIKDCHFDLIRVGLNIYKNAFKLIAPIRHIQFAQKNTSVGYGSQYICNEDCYIAVIGMGYADGLPTQLSNKGHVIINTIPYPIVGKICMDMFMIKIPKNNNVALNDVATIISDGKDKALTIQEIATLTDANPREIMTRFSSRVTRTLI